MPDHLIKMEHMHSVIIVVVVIIYFTYCSKFLRLVIKA